MKQTYMPCIDCAYALQARHPDFELSWIWLAEGKTIDDPYILLIDVDQDDLYTVLEHMGFIVTHESEPGSYIVKLLGFREGSQLICVHRHIT